MTTQHNAIEEGGAAVPVACSLTPAGLAARTARWEQLAARAMTGRAETAHGLRLYFRPEPGAEEQLRTLAAVENDCCAWASWTVQTRTGEIVLEVRSAGEGIAALHHMFTGLRQAPAARRDRLSTLGDVPAGQTAGRAATPRAASDQLEPSAPT